jgi:hypothetical protein
MVRKAAAVFCEWPADVIFDEGCGMGFCMTREQYAIFQASIGVIKEWAAGAPIVVRDVTSRHPYQYVKDMSRPIADKLGGELQFKKDPPKTFKQPYEAEFWNGVPSDTCVVLVLNNEDFRSLVCRLRLKLKYGAHREDGCGLFLEASPPDILCVDVFIPE